MNYGLFHQWVLDRVEELVSMGVSRREANHLMTALELGAIADEARNRADNQFLLDFNRRGAESMAKCHNKTPAWARKRRREILAKQTVATPVS
ncbi:hypothetical protein LF41_2404 [Lysobacter dokdonensis DS-58]|uniref:Uncharacterized protein n=1 Tax=Lysobacter dokdonensis DS-58 TaxID=1300345 RepID=A0A0A2WMD2_9GAMM|nr:hypothetical protein [Lysobacter dokdonensis]KGQ19897.1 hypothetical protein LF41_2404 [Lysobacter dokdonensis DS-58]